jgi:putative CocE/NonD family hydrolase
MAINEIKVELNVAVPMRDGTVLRADIYRPNVDQPLPTLVIRLPYEKGNPSVVMMSCDPMRFARNGYAVVIQDCRGCHASDGEWSPFRKDREDGYDTIEWAAAQPWSSGKVGMYGGSYLGTLQWMAASGQPPHLVAMAPMVSPSSGRSMMFQGGVFQLKTAQFLTLGLMAMHARRYHAPSELPGLMRGVLDAFDNTKRESGYLPLKAWPVGKKSRFMNFYFDFMEHPTKDEYWRDFEFAVYERTVVPACIVYGWYDFSTELGGLTNYTEMKTRGGTEHARKNVKLIVGPWVHGVELNSVIGEIDFGILATGAATDLIGVYLRWFDYWLKGIDNGITSEPPVRIFVMGDNIWRNENEWPLARTEYTNYYLHSGGKANSSGGDGFLSLDLPSSEPKDGFLYDPLNPVPTLGGRLLRDAGAIDQSEIEQRKDVLVYSTEPLVTDLEVTGPITMKLYAQSSAPDTDFTAKLVDVWPSGKAYILADGIVRARYRDSDEMPSLIEPDQVYEYAIDLAATSNVFKAGHRIRLEISSSNFPKYDRNPNTGHDIGVDAETRVARQLIFHDDVRPSRLILPVIPR